MFGKAVGPYSMYELTNFLIENCSQISSINRQCLSLVGRIIYEYVFMYLKQTKEAGPKSPQFTDSTSLALSRKNKQISQTF